MRHTITAPSLWFWALLAVFFSRGTAFAQFAQAPVEVRVPVVPRTVAGSDGLMHLAYELHVSNFYQSTGTLRLRRVAVFVEGEPTPLASFTGGQVNDLLAHPASSTAVAGVPIGAGQRVVLLLWLSLPTKAPVPHVLRHQLEFEPINGAPQLVDGIQTLVDVTPPVVLGAPLRAGRWLVYEGPGNRQAHHWGSLVAVNGQLTIPQRYAIDFFGLDETSHAVRIAPDKLKASRLPDWIGFGTEVLAVADGVVRDARDNEPNNEPFASLSPPTDLTNRTVLGNFVVLEIAPRVFVSYAHLHPGSLTVRAGDRVRRGDVLGRLGQSGNANAPHLHFQVSNAPTFEESEGLPFVFDAFGRLGTARINTVLDQTARIYLGPSSAQPPRQQLPLDGDIITFK
jgi:murein DD-endopeptidase MepM/ murein hydrolase activator NlpD